MEILHLLCCVSVAFTGLTSGAGVLPGGPLRAAVGGTVMFITAVTPPEQPFLAVFWIFKTNLYIKHIITSTYKNVTGQGYESRITLFRSTGSLQLRKLTRNDGGVYQVNIVTHGGLMRGDITLKILEPISSVTASVNETDLVEFNSSARLSCSSSGSSLTFLWLNGSSEMTDSGRVKLTGGGRSLTIVNVSHYDQGPFRCSVSNAVSTGISDPVKLPISYGPDNINIKTCPAQESHKNGSDITLSCSVVSRPAAQFHWFFNRTMLSETGPELRLTNIQVNQSGDYSCQAFNIKTLRYQTSHPSAVTVIERHPSVSCSAGCIVGIVMACVVMVVVAAGLLVNCICLKKRQRPRQRNIITLSGIEICIIEFPEQRCQDCPEEISGQLDIIY